ncbi:uncharacterized protein LOC141537173 [Cotesia typhae]|uniref:uncharacterized protein LOC141537173 n=1 Tax=Cotesia typhae TaxID=2053667 RepID=UPI003D69CA19
MEKLRQPRNDGVINDIYDSQLYKAVQKLSPGALTYNVNTDGAPLTKSSKRSMWPIQLHINELSPTLRFRNVLLGGLYITSAELSPEFMQTYMSKFLEKANNIMEADSVARPVIQNRFQFNGYLGCSWCYATGVYDSSVMRYPITQQVPLLRPNQSHIKDVEQVEKLGKSINGVKGVSRHLWALWTKPGTPYYLNPQQRKKIMARQLHIKRPQEIHRLVRTVDQTAKWKASEWESWLLFDSVPYLAGILDEKCFQSYLLLVSSIYTLMTDNISEEDLLLCEINLLQFVRDCQLIYDVNSMTFNLHSLSHVVESVRQSGPLWSSSAFPFESMIFLIKRYITVVSGVSNQIVNSILKEKNIRCNIDYNTESVKCRNYCKDLFKPRKLKNCTRSDDHALLIGTEKSPDDQLILLMHQYFDNTHSTKVYDRCIYNKMVLRSTAYTRPTKTNDTAISNGTEVHDNLATKVHDNNDKENSKFILNHSKDHENVLKEVTTPPKTLHPEKLDLLSMKIEKSRRKSKNRQILKTEKLYHRKTTSYLSHDGGSRQVQNNGSMKSTGSVKLQVKKDDKSITVTKSDAHDILPDGLPNRDIVEGNKQKEIISEEHDNDQLSQTKISGSQEVDPTVSEIAETPEFLEQINLIKDSTATTLNANNTSLESGSTKTVLEESAAEQDDISCEPFRSFDQPVNESLKKKKKSKLSDKKPKRSKSSKKSKIKNQRNESENGVMNEVRQEINDIKKSQEAFQQVVTAALQTILSNWQQIQSTRATVPTAVQAIDFENIQVPPPVGFIRTDTEMIHCGQNVWITVQDYNNAKAAAGTDAIFVKI